MKKTVVLVIFLTTMCLGYSQNIYEAVSGEVSFFSETPVENIDAVNKDIKALLNIEKGEMAFIIANIGFRFKKPLMEEHFNENYMESDKYKTSVFKGKIIDPLDYSKDGKYQVVVKGMLNIHGVEKEREMEGEITIGDGIITMISEFEVKVKDHKIKIPKLVVKNIAETVKVKVNIEFKVKD